MTAPEMKPPPSRLERGGGTAEVDASGNFVISGDLDHNGTNAGFYSTTPIAQQTGVAVTAGGVHAALVALGLITA
ncbi:MAG: hypothetical protein QQN63_06265 [Nitrosopumilus sp.]